MDSPYRLIEKTESAAILHEAAVRFIAAFTLFEKPFVGCDEGVGPFR